MEDEKVNMNIVEGQEMFAHEVSINFNPTQIIFDFKSITPRIDPRSQKKASLVMRHNVVLMDPFSVKRFNEMLSKALDRFEKDFGKIEKPKALKKLEKQRKDKKEPKEEAAPTYFG